MEKMLSSWGILYIVITNIKHTIFRWDLPMKERFYGRNGGDKN